MITVGILAAGGRVIGSKQSWFPKRPLTAPRRDEVMVTTDAPLALAESYAIACKCVSLPRRVGYFPGAGKPSRRVGAFHLCVVKSYSFVFSSICASRPEGKPTG